MKTLSLTRPIENKLREAMTIDDHSLVLKALHEDWLNRCHGGTIVVFSNVKH